ncbi:putative tubulin polyglutamylase TTLL9 [Calliopsis andreniformis]|uniref:putative tubulin polyglutamylase TTLL9 n=1 Tax=Calliopsis andreniformis TaxID=337506 RepID=UPI003FCDFF68
MIIERGGALCVSGIKKAIVTPDVVRAFFFQGLNNSFNKKKRFIDIVHFIKSVISFNCFEIEGKRKYINKLSAFSRFDNSMTKIKTNKEIPKIKKIFNFKIVTFKSYYNFCEKYLFENLIMALSLPHTCNYITSERTRATLGLNLLEERYATEISPNAYGHVIIRPNASDFFPDRFADSIYERMPRSAASVRESSEPATENGSLSTQREKRCPNARKKQNGDDKVIKFRCDFPSTQVRVMLARGWTQITDANDTSWHLWWCEITDVRLALDSKLTPYQKIPHFRNHYELTRKNFLYRNLKRYKKSLLKSKKIAEAELCDSMPLTFELPNDYRLFAEEYHKQPGATWIVKPAGRSQGRGIFLFRKLKDLAEWRTREFGIQPMEMPAETFIVQRYVENPYLLAGRKFDLRIYALVTSFHPLKAWLAREGFARLSAELFDLDNIDDSRVHLTNMAIQLKIDGHEKKEELKKGCKWALIRVREFLTARHGAEAVEALFQRIAGVIMASLLAVQPVIMQGRNSFELYGYDILLDEDLTPWLLEVNASPALTGTDTEDYRLKFDLLDDTLNVLDFEGRFTGRETRIGGFDLLWNDGPVWTACPNPTICGEPPNDLRKLNIFLGARNDRVGQLRQLRDCFHGRRNRGQSSRGGDSSG